MGRKHYTERLPQHSRHARERELVRSGLKPATAEAIGVKRPLERGSAMRLVSGLVHLQQVGELPEELNFDTRLALELMPLRLIGNQTRKGLVQISDPTEIGRKVMRKMGIAKYETVEADIKGVSMQTGGDLRVTVKSEALELERRGIAEVLERQGFKGLLRHCGETALHINVATCGRHQLPYEERLQSQMTIVQAIDDIHHFEEPLAFEGWRVYPQAYQQAA